MLQKSLAVASLCLACVLASAVRSNAQSAVPMGSHPIEATNFSFECLVDSSCGNKGGWIATTSQPGTVRLWNSGTNWAMLETAAGKYDWSNLDAWLDLIAKHQPTAVIYTFGYVPCWIANSCNSVTGGGLVWSTDPPRDLGSGGSAAFKDFVTALTTHCSAAGHCVKNYIKYWEMWNEANLTTYWSGTPTQLYDMFKPAVAIIRSNVPGAKVSTPPVCGGDRAWMTSWMALENANGKLSDYYGIHVYLRGNTPEERMGMVERMLATKNSNGWTSTPWMNTETGFDINTYVCSEYTLSVCQSQLVRWYILQYAYQAGAGGAYLVSWFDWPTIGSQGYDTYYYTTMQWLVGSTFASSCSSNGNVWTCPMTESNGTSALIVWNAQGDSQYKPASQYTDYKKFNGTYGGDSTSVATGENITIGLLPVMFETK
jgi:hypothetical protein